ncbi:uncharacterized protein BXZ73DRAFT_81300 [Epithele typhae]|uniref:uncharacterized protein n=1 Tax=Epithele typhae TaxID=378194 RepID=UPI00200816E2|nr:uncharacterized protein BXZ73DRAFT_81300 [Epithele typhae]KAH9915569.1 hypothetical protein BXZ73DRAFT_81300 [Epithele typhae]
MTPLGTDGLPPCPVRDGLLKRISEIEDAAGEAAEGEEKEASALQVARGDERCAAWNSTPSINLLPTELLLRIFAACFQPTSFAEENPKRTHLRRKVLLLVCRRWRDLIESAPTLWTFVSPHAPPRLYDLLLSRAARAGLDFSFKRKYKSEWSSSLQLSPDLAPLDLPDGGDDRTISDGGDEDDGGTGDGHPGRGWTIDSEGYSSKVWSEEAGVAIAAQSKRTRSLALVDADRLFYTLPFFEALFRDRTWPILTTLFVDFTDIYEDIFPVLNAEFLSLTPARFPRLQHLTLNMVLPGTIEPTLFPQLRTLDLTGPTSHWPPVEDFLICLSQSPRLEKLLIRLEHNMSQDRPADHSPPAPTSALQLPLTLPRLRSLSLGAARHEEVMVLLQAFPLARADLDVTGLFNEDWRQPPTNVEAGRRLSIVDAFYPDRGETMPIPFTRSAQRLHVCADRFRATIMGLAESDGDLADPLFEWTASPVPKYMFDSARPNRYDLSCGINDVVTLFGGSPLRRLNFSADDFYTEFYICATVNAAYSTTRVRLIYRVLYDVLRASLRWAWKGSGRAVPTPTSLDVFRRFEGWSPCSSSSRTRPRTLSRRPTRADCLPEAPVERVRARARKAQPVGRVRARARKAQPVRERLHQQARKGEPAEDGMKQWACEGEKQLARECSGQQALREEGWERRERSRRQCARARVKRPALRAGENLKLARTNRHAWHLRISRQPGRMHQRIPGKGSESLERAGAKQLVWTSVGQQDQCTPEKGSELPAHVGMMQPAQTSVEQQDQCTPEKGSARVEGVVLARVIARAGMREMIGA